MLSGCHCRTLCPASRKRQGLLKPPPSGKCSPELAQHTSCRSGSVPPARAPCFTKERTEHNHAPDAQSRGGKEHGNEASAHRSLPLGRPWALRSSGRNPPLGTQGRPHRGLWPALSFRPTGPSRSPLSKPEAGVEWKPGLTDGHELHSQPSRKPTSCIPQIRKQPPRAVLGLARISTWHSASWSD